MYIKICQVKIPSKAHSWEILFAFKTLLVTLAMTNGWAGERERERGGWKEPERVCKKLGNFWKVCEQKNKSTALAQQKMRK
jgi:hypothetical protein